MLGWELVRCITLLKPHENAPIHFEASVSQLPNLLYVRKVDVVCLCCWYLLKEWFVCLFCIYCTSLSISLILTVSSLLPLLLLSRIALRVSGDYHLAKTQEWAAKNNKLRWKAPTQFSASVVQLFLHRYIQFTVIQTRSVKYEFLLLFFFSFFRAMWFSFLTPSSRSIVLATSLFTQNTEFNFVYFSAQMRKKKWRAAFYFRLGSV